MNAMEYTDYDALPGYAQAEQEDSTKILLQRIAYMLRDRWVWLLVASLVLGTGFAVLGFLSQPELYRARGTIEINEQLPGVTDTTLPTARTSEGFLRTEMEYLTHQRVLERMMEKLEWEAQQFAGLNDVSDLLQYVNVRNRMDTKLVDIYFVHTRPEYAVMGVKALMESHQEIFSSKYSRRDAERRQALASKRAKLSSDLDELGRQYDALLGDGTERTLEKQQDNLFEEIVSLEEQLASVQAAIDRMGSEDGEPMLSNLSVEQLGEIDAGVDQLLRDRDDLRLLMDSLRASGMGENHRRMQRASRELAVVNDRIDQRAERLRLGLISPQALDGEGNITDNASLDQLRAQKQSLENRIANKDAELKAIGKRLRELRDTQQEMAKLEAELEEVQERIAQINSEVIGEHIETVAVPNWAAPYKPENRIIFAIAGGGFGVSLAFGLVLLWGFVDRRFKHLDEAELELPQLLGSLPEVPHSRDDPAMSLEIANNIHRIRARLQVGRGDESCVFSVTSPAQQAGKTSLALALGLSYASAGIRTLVVDADVVGGGLTKRLKAMVHQRLGHMLVSRHVIDQATLDRTLEQQRASDKLLGELLVEQGHLTQEQLEGHLEEQQKTSVGLLDACRGQELSACVAHTNHKSLDVLPIGTALAHEAGSIAPAAMHRVIRAARETYEVVLIDSGPILGSVDATLAASAADASLLIFTRNERQALVNKAIAAFDHIDGNLAGIVFNRAMQKDIVRSSYGSVTSSVSRAAYATAPSQTIDPEATTSFGPLARSVAMYATTNGTAQSNGRARPPREETDADARDLMARP